MERVLSRPMPRDARAGDSLAHRWCKRCNGLTHPDQEPDGPVTSMCGQARRVPNRSLSGRAMCVVCDDYSQANRCPKGHKLRSWG